MKRISWPSARPFASYRKSQGISGPLYLGMDTHALSEPALYTAIEVFAANGVEIVIQRGHGLHPHPGDLACHPDLQPRPDDTAWRTGW